ncbi:MAG: TetR family transcriptional regulator C-terminal domain-containing protein [Proteobacteria bacterium]|nr:TetR family transcriptional regulator C-terminal domain-containing protein [Pseudomonadota bacterium]
MATTAKKTSRTATREKRRQQLIDATMKCIARKGMGSTTLGDVAGEAGLSQGIVNLHFESKDNLLNETLRYLADEYKTQFSHAYEKSGPGAADKLHALMKLDLSPSVLDRRKVAVWFAFWGEVKSRPIYRDICEKSDEYYDEIVRSLCSQLIAEGDYKNITALAISTALASMTNGMWLSCLISPKLFDRQNAMIAVDEYLHSIFPEHFPL